MRVHLIVARFDQEHTDVRSPAQLHGVRLNDEVHATENKVGQCWYSAGQRLRTGVLATEPRVKDLAERGIDSSGGASPST